MERWLILETGNSQSIVSPTTVVIPADVQIGLFECVTWQQGSYGSRLRPLHGDNVG